MTSKTPLRSTRWFERDDLRSSGHRSRMMQMGYAMDEWIGRPVVAIINTWSDANPCHAHFRQRAEDVKRGILQAGGFPMELPAISLSESLVKPTTMLYRNMLAMETEELLRSHPVDGAVLMGGCDKTTPGLIMGALSAGLPMIYLPAGPMLRGNYRGEALGSGSDAWKYWDERRAGSLDDKAWAGVEAGIARSYGHCMTMGTASTMTAIADAMGLTLPGASSIPAADSGHIRMSSATGKRIVQMIEDTFVPSLVIDRRSIRNAAVVAMATGCSTNAVVHLIAMARRAGVDFSLDDLDAIGRSTPVIANVRPSGKTYLMEDFFYAGGLLALMSELGDRLDGTAMTVSGLSLAETLVGAETINADVIRPVSNPVYHEGALAVLKGNLAPNGCVIKPSACSRHLLIHEGRAVVFDSYPALKAGTEDVDFDWHADDVLVLRNAGPQGGPGMPEWGMLPIPVKLLRQGVRDMVRISDARMSGTSYGACILHVAPEAHIGGPLAAVRTGDRIRVDVPQRTIDLLVAPGELEARLASLEPRKPYFERGYGWIFSKHIKQADEGCDFDFLETEFGAAVREPEIY